MIFSNNIIIYFITFALRRGEAASRTTENNFPFSFTQMVLREIFMNDSAGNIVELNERKIVNFNGFFAPLRLDLAKQALKVIPKF